MGIKEGPAAGWYCDMGVKAGSAAQLLVCALLAICCTDDCTAWLLCRAPSFKTLNIG